VRPHFTTLPSISEADLALTNLARLLLVSPTLRRQPFIFFSKQENDTRTSLGCGWRHSDRTVTKRRAPSAALHHNRDSEFLPALFVVAPEGSLVFHRSNCTYLQVSIGNDESDCQKVGAYRCSQGSSLTLAPFLFVIPAGPVDVLFLYMS